MTSTATTMTEDNARRRIFRFINYHYFHYHIHFKDDEDGFVCECGRVRYTDKGLFWQYSEDGYFCLTCRDEADEEDQHDCCLECYERDCISKHDKSCCVCAEELNCENYSQACVICLKPMCDNCDNCERQDKDGFSVCVECFK